MIDKNYNPLNPMVGQVKQFLDEKQIPEEQVVPFLMSLGHRGLAGAVAGRMRLEKASEGLKSLQQGKNAAPPTVVQENAQNAQQVQQQVQQAMAMQQPQTQTPQQMPTRGMYGGGIVSLARGGGPIAFQEGGEMLSQRQFMREQLGQVDELVEAYDRAAGNPAEQSRIQKMIQKAFPTFSSVEALKGELAKLRGSGSGIVSKAGKLAGRAAVPLAAVESAYQGSMTDPSILAEEYGMDPNRFGRQATAQGLGYLENLASNLSFGAYGALRGRPYDRARERTEQRIADINRGGPQLNLSSEEAAIGQEFNRIVREYGANSKEAKDFEARYRDAMSRASPAAEDELARIMSQSAASEPTAGASAARPAGPRLPSVSTTARETKTLSDLRGRLKGMEDVSKPEAREAAIDREIAARMKRYTDMGIMKPFDDAKANVQGRLKELDGIKDKNFYKAMAMMGFTMAGTRGSFFQALAAGGAAGLSAYETFEERRQATLDKLQDRMMNIDMGIANIKERAGAGAETRVDKLESERNRVQDQITNLQSAQETLAQTQSFQLAMSDREIAANTARDEARFGGLDKAIEKEILKYRAIADSTVYTPDVRAAAKAKVEELYRERERATQVGSGSFQSAALKAGAGQIPGYSYPMVGSEQGGASDDIDALVAQYLKQ
jgi:hypothetical protein